MENQTLNDLLDNAGEALENYIVRFNELSERVENDNTQNVLLTQQNKALLAQVNEQQALIEKQDHDLVVLSKGLKDYEKLLKDVNESRKLLEREKRLHDETRKIVREYSKQVGSLEAAKNNLARQKAQKKRHTEALEKRDTMIKALRKEISLQRDANKQALAERNNAVDAVRLAKRELMQAKSAGLYHNGKDHLIYWPQPTTVQDADGNTKTGRSLLYLHQSGCGKLFHYDSENDAVSMGALPRGGLKPSAETIDFAYNWLFKVNALQSGEVTENDLLPENHNHEFN